MEGITKLATLIVGCILTLIFYGENLSSTALAALFLTLGVAMVRLAFSMSIMRWIFRP